MRDKLDFDRVRQALRLLIRDPRPRKRVENTCLGTGVSNHTWLLSLAQLDSHSCSLFDFTYSFPLPKQNLRKSLLKIEDLTFLEGIHVAHNMSENVARLRLMKASSSYCICFYTLSCTNTRLLYAVFLSSSFVFIGNSPHLAFHWRKQCMDNMVTPLLMHKAECLVLVKTLPPKSIWPCPGRL